MHGIRPAITGDEADWARDYERSSLPPDTVFPGPAEAWEAAIDCEVTVHHVFAAPVSNCGTAMLAAGTKVRILDGSIDPQPIFVSFVPVRYEALQQSLVPQDILAEPRYANYVLSLGTAAFNKCFRRLGVGRGSG